MLYEQDVESDISKSLSWFLIIIKVPDFQAFSEFPVVGLTWQEFMFKNGFFDEIVRHQLCAVDQGVPRDVRQSSCIQTNHINNRDIHRDHQCCCFLSKARAGMRKKHMHIRIKKNFLAKIYFEYMLCTSRKYIFQNILRNVLRNANK